jgi:hypothetical protein
MCFCFDGEGTVRSHGPDKCRERAVDAPEEQSRAPVGEPGRLDVAGKSESVEPHT